MFEIDDLGSSSAGSLSSSARSAACCFCRSRLTQGAARHRPDACAIRPARVQPRSTAHGRQPSRGLSSRPRRACRRLQMPLLLHSPARLVNLAAQARPDPEGRRASVPLPSRLAARHRSTGSRSACRWARLCRCASIRSSRRGWRRPSRASASRASRSAASAASSLLGGFSAILLHCLERSITLRSKRPRRLSSSPATLGASCREPVCAQQPLGRRGPSRARQSRPTGAAARRGLPAAAQRRAAAPGPHRQRRLASGAEAARAELRVVGEAFDVPTGKRGIVGEDPAALPSPRPVAADRRVGIFA